MGPRPLRPGSFCLSLRPRTSVGPIGACDAVMALTTAVRRRERLRTSLGADMSFAASALMPSRLSRRSLLEWDCSV